MNKQETLNKIKNGIVVSCQAIPGNPLERECARNMLLMAECAALGGAIGFRANSPENIKPIKEKYPDMPMIGIWKIMTPGNPIYITPTMKEVDALAELGCEIIALDLTNQINTTTGKYAWEIIKDIKAKYPDICIMADIDNVDDAVIAYLEGADFISTTMNGYTANSKVREVSGQTDGEPNFENLREIRAALPDAFILFEGRLYTREDCVNAFKFGANCLCVGKAITNPYKMTERLVGAVNKYFEEQN